MSRATFILRGQRERAEASRFLANAPPLTVVTFKRNRRTVDQNSLMWRLLTVLARDLEWHGQKYTAEDWKDYMMHALRRARWMPSEDGGMIPVGLRTSDNTKEEQSDLIEFLYAFGARHEIDFGEDGKGASGANNPARDAA